MSTSTPPAVHVGNVAEYNRQFFPASFRTDHRVTWDLEGHHYAGLAPFYSAMPGIVVTPLAPMPEWTELQLAVLDWPHLDLRPGMCDGAGDVCPAILGDAALLADVVAAVDAGSAIVPWGHSPEFWKLREQVGRGHVGGTGPPPRQDRFESKAAAHRRFRLVAREADNIRMTRQDLCRSIEEAATVLADRIATTGQRQVLKSDFSVGGFGTHVVTPDDVRSAADAHRLLAALIDDDAIFAVLPLLVEEYASHPPTTAAQPTFNGEVLPDGTVRSRGCAVMDVSGTKYVGAVVGAGLDEPVRRRIEAYGRAVGELMRDEGYVGWYDIDFLRTADDALVPTETNARRTGPTVAISIAANIAAATGDAPVVRTNDRVPLTEPVPERVMLDRFRRACADVRSSGVSFIPTITTATNQDVAYFGFAAVGGDIDRVDLACQEFTHRIGGGHAEHAQGSHPRL